MEIRQITSGFAVAPQIAEADVAALAAKGFRAILNNRPDGEVPGQPATAAIEAAAARHGLAYRMVPVVSGQITEADVTANEAALAELDGPVLAYCRTGTRCTVLWALGEAGRRPLDEVVALAAQAGYDLAPLRPTLEARARAAADPSV